MKNTFTLLLTLFTALLLAQSNSDINVPLSNPNEAGYLEIHIHNGDISVIGEERNDVAVQYDVDDDSPFRKNKNKTKNGLKRIGKPKAGLEITEDNNVVIIDTDSHSNELELLIMVPKNFNVNISNHNGDDLEVRNVTGEVNIESHNSDITAMDISGTVNAQSYNGDIDIEIEQISGSKDMSFGSYNGDIDLRIPSSYKADFKLKSQNGEILSDLDLEEVAKTPELKSSNNGSFKLYTDSWTYAQLNGGGSEIKINTNNGDITLRGSN